MERYLELCGSNPLFAGMSREELAHLLECLQAKKCDYSKGSVIFSVGDRAVQLGMVLSGRVHTVHESLFGGRSIIGSMEPGQLFCDAFACSGDQRLPVSVVAQTDAVVLLINAERILHTCPNACSQHQRLQENLIHILAEKYVLLNRKVIHLSGRSTRKKLLSYLSGQRCQAGGDTFPVPFNQQELADYLFTERSGLSTEWNRLKKEGILVEPAPGRYQLKTPPCVGGDCDS